MKTALRGVLYPLIFCCALTACYAQSAADQSPPYLHPDFDLAPSELAVILEGLPPGLRSEIEAQPGVFLGDYLPLLDYEWDRLVLVDKKNALPEGYEPPDLVSLNDFPLQVSRRDLKLRKNIMPEVLHLVQGAKKAGLSLLFSSAQRTYNYQRGLFDRYVKQDGLAEAERYSARAGHSQHQLGTVMDFGSVTEAFAKTAEGKWLDQYAGDFGFSLSYPKGFEGVTGYVWEPWHYRYLGVEAVRVQKKWFGNIQQYLLEFHQRNGPILKLRLRKPKQ